MQQPNHAVSTDQVQVVRFLEKESLRLREDPKWAKHLLETKRNEYKAAVQETARITAETTNILHKLLSQSKDTLEKVNKISHHGQNLIEALTEFIAKNQDESQFAEQILKSKVRLAKLKAGIAYLNLVQRVQTLCNQFSSESTLSSYDSLLEYSRNLLNNSTAQSLPGVSLQDTKLFNFISTAVVSAFNQLKTTLESSFRDVLQKIDWPTSFLKDPETTIPKTLLSEFQDSFLNLLTLEHIDEDEHHEIILPLNILTEEPALRFNYHFASSRPTNRLDKPEWALDHFLNEVSNYSLFLTIYVQPLLASYGFITDAKNYFAEQWLECAVRPKIKSDLKAIVELGTEDVDEVVNEDERGSQQTRTQTAQSLLCNYVLSILKFESTLQNEHLFSTPNIMSIITTNDAICRFWLDAELESCLRTLHASGEDSKEWDYIFDRDSEDDDECCVPRNALTLVDTIVKITDTYQSLSPSAFLRLFNAVHLTLLQSYLITASQWMDAYVREISVIKLPSTTSSQMADNAYRELKLKVDGGRLGVLCRVATGLWWIRKSCVEWGEEMVYLSLWQHLDDNQPSEESEAMLFDSVVADYDRALNRCLTLLTDDIMRDTISLLKPYERKPFDVSSSGMNDESNDKHGHAKSPVSTSPQENISPELGRPLHALSNYIALIEAQLNNVIFDMVLKQLSIDISEWLQNNIIESKLFSEMGGLQFKFDLEMGFSKVLGKFSKRCLRNVRESSILLSLPSSHSTRQNIDLPTMLDILSSVDANEGRESAEAKAVLEKIGVLNLGVVKTKHVLTRRMDYG